MNDQPVVTTALDDAKAAEAVCKTNREATATAAKAAKAHLEQVSKGLADLPADAENKAEWEAAVAEAAASNDAAKAADADAAAKLKAAKDATKAARDAERDAKKAAKEQKEADRAAAKAQRVVKNDVARPSAGTKTGAVWEKADELSASLGRPVLLNELKAALSGVIADGTTGTQYNHWCTFNDVSAEQRKAARADVKAAAAPAPAPAPTEETAPTEEAPAA